ncbi:MAG: 30S ribosome-binding factor RbfA [Betaproteobacteria bacterium]
MAVKKSFSRKERVSEQIRRELADLIRTELKDPRVGMISITDVEVTADYAHAKIFFSSMSGSENLEEIMTGLQKSSGFLRRELGKRISIHMTPQLHFVFDHSLERGADLSKLIQKAVAISSTSDTSSDSSSDLSEHTPEN